MEPQPRSDSTPLLRALAVAAALSAATSARAIAQPVTARELMSVCGFVDYPAESTAKEAAAALAKADPLGPSETAFIDALCALDGDSLGTPPGPAFLNHPDPRATIRRAVERREVAAQPPDGLAAETIAAPGQAVATSAGFQTALLWGLSEFLVKRAKEQVDTWLLDRIRDVCLKPIITDSGKPTIQELLPQSCALLRRDVLPELLGGMSTLRAAIRKDLKSLPRTLGTLTAATLCEKDDPACDSFVTLLLVGTFAERVAGGTAPLEAALSLPEPEWAKEQLAGLLSVNRTGGTLRLIRAIHLIQAIAVVEAGGVLRLDTPGDTPDVFFKSAVRAALVNTLAFRKGYGDEPPEGMDTWDQLLSIRMAPGKDMRTDLQPVMKAASEAFERFRILAQTMARLDLGKSPQLQALGLAVEGSLSLLDVTIDVGGGSDVEKAKQVLATAAPFVRSLTEPDYGALVVQLLSLAKESKVNTKPDVARLLSFGVELAQAHNATSMEAAFEHFAAPAGSFKAKRTRPWYVTLNAYVGGFAGSETSEREGVECGFGCSRGAWVPIGVEAGWGGLGKEGDSHSLGLFVHALDLGALAAYRTNAPDSPLESAPNVTLSQVFSSGLFVVWGVKNMPLSVAAGVSYSPGLRAIKGSGTPETQLHAAAVRYGVAIAIDIPLFP